jgi:hypothetical protein
MSVSLDETTNDFGVGMLTAEHTVRGHTTRVEEFVLCLPPRGPFSREQGLRLAAYLVALSAPEGFDDFLRVLNAVRRT